MAMLMTLSHHFCKFIFWAAHSWHGVKGQLYDMATKNNQSESTSANRCYDDMEHPEVKCAKEVVLQQ